MSGPTRPAGSRSTFQSQKQSFWNVQPSRISKHDISYNNVEKKVFIAEDSRDLDESSSMMIRGIDKLNLNNARDSIGTTNRINNAEEDADDAAIAAELIGENKKRILPVRRDEESTSKFRARKKGIVSEFIEIQQTSNGLQLGDFVEQVKRILLKLEGPLHLTVVAGKKGTGKSTFLNRLLDLPTKQGFPVRNETEWFMHGSNDLLFYAQPIQEFNVPHGNNGSVPHNIYLDLQPINPKNPAHLKLLLCAYLLADTFIYHTDDPKQTTFPLFSLSPFWQIRSMFKQRNIEGCLEMPLIQHIPPRIFFLLKPAIVSDVRPRETSAKTGRSDERYTIPSLFGDNSNNFPSQTITPSNTIRRNKQLKLRTLVQSPKAKVTIDSPSFKKLPSSSNRDSGSLSALTQQSISLQQIPSPIHTNNPNLNSDKNQNSFTDMLTNHRHSNQYNTNNLQENILNERNSSMQEAEVILYRDDEDIKSLTRHKQSQQSDVSNNNRNSLGSATSPLSNNRQQSQQQQQVDPSSNKNSHVKSPTLSPSRFFNKSRIAMLSLLKDENYQFNNENTPLAVEDILSKHSSNRLYAKRIGGVTCNSRMLVCFTKKIIEELNKNTNQNNNAMNNPNISQLNIEDIENYVVKTECEQVAETFFSQFLDDAQPLLTNIADTPIQFILFSFLQIRESALSRFSQYFKQLDFRTNSLLKTSIISLSDRMDIFCKNLCELHRQSIQAAKESKRKALLPGYFKAAMKDVRYSIHKKNKKIQNNRVSSNNSNKHNSPGILMDTDITTADQRSDKIFSQFKKKAYYQDQQQQYLSVNRETREQYGLENVEQELLEQYDMNDNRQEVRSSEETGINNDDSLENIKENLIEDNSTDNHNTSNDDDDDDSVIDSNNNSMNLSFRKQITCQGKVFHILSPISANIKRPQNPNTIYKPIQPRNLFQLFQSNNDDVCQTIENDIANYETAGQEGHNQQYFNTPMRQRAIAQLFSSKSINSSSSIRDILQESQELQKGEIEQLRSKKASLQSSQVKLNQKKQFQQSMKLSSSLPQQQQSPPSAVKQQHSETPSKQLINFSSAFKSTYIELFQNIQAPASPNALIKSIILPKQKITQESQQKQEKQTNLKGAVKVPNKGTTTNPTATSTNNGDEKNNNNNYNNDADDDCEDDEILSEDEYTRLEFKSTYMIDCVIDSFKQFSEQYFNDRKELSISAAISQYQIFIQNSYPNVLANFAARYAKDLKKLLQHQQLLQFKGKRHLKDILFQRSQILKEQTTYLDGYMKGLHKETASTRKLLEYNSLESQLYKQKYKLNVALKEKDEEIRKLEEELQRLKNK